MPDPVRLERRGQVLEITLDRPKANAIDAKTSRAMGEAFDSFQNDPDLRVAILTGAGERIFSAGWDLNTAEDEDQDYGSGGFGGLMNRFDLDKPVIAAVNGACAAGGFEIALAADLMVAADHAFFFLSEATLGLTVGAVSVARLFERVPHQTAVDMLYTGRRIDTEAALRLGLVAEVVPMEELMDASRSLAERIIASAPLSVAAMKEMITKVSALPVAEADRIAKAGGLPAQKRAGSSEDAKEGPRAFNEKRAPVWKGK
jgi:crotonobetainyl-CoA hydratase